MTRRHRRDFLLDSGGVSALAGNADKLAAYLALVSLDFDGALLVPVPVLTEVRSGYRRIDVQVDRLLKAIGAEGDLYLPLTVTWRTVQAFCARSPSRAVRPTYQPPMRS